MRRTKILATLGPASESTGAIEALHRAGANAFRVNFSHGTDAQRRGLFRKVRQLGPADRGPVALVADIQGPKIRLGDLSPPQVQLTKGDRWILDTDPTPGGVGRSSVTLPELLRVVNVGDPILLGDGSVSLQVRGIGASSVETEVRSGGRVGSRAGVYLPQARLRPNLLGRKDRADIRAALDEGADFLAISFVRSADDLRSVREVVRGHPRGREVALIAKIERAEALQHIEGILAEADALMVARGDLGIEVALERLATIQKSLVRRANAAAKPVIVATQMLLSMVTNPRPTRAEATDAANAILDGADVLMLSEETAVGQYPVEAVGWLDRIARSTEEAVWKGEAGFSAAAPAEPTTEQSIAAAAVRLADSLSAAAIVTPTHSGRTARLVSARRPQSPIVALASRPGTRQRLALTWGVRAVDAPDHGTLQEFRRAAEAAGRELLEARGSRPIVLTAGWPLEGRPTNLITVLEVPRRRSGAEPKVPRGRRRAGARVPGRPRRS